MYSPAAISREANNPVPWMPESATWTTPRNCASVRRFAPLMRGTATLHRYVPVAVLHPAPAHLVVAAGRSTSPDRVTQPDRAILALPHHQQFFHQRQHLDALALGTGGVDVICGQQVAALGVQNSCTYVCGDPGWRSISSTVGGVVGISGITERAP